MYRWCFILFACFPAAIFAQADSTRIAHHLGVLTQTLEFRTHKNTEQLNATSAYLLSELRKFCDTVYYQPYEANGKQYRNVIGEMGPKNTPLLVVGAHYDVCSNQQGADDNASGVAGLLELSHILHEKKLDNRIQFVAYTLEEPPFFRTDKMGSYVHAESLHQSNQTVLGMISLEMIGYFDDAKGSQDYPVNLLKLVYGSRGNFITLVNKMNKGKFARRLSRKFKQYAQLKTKKFTAPAALPGIDFSDHLNYWKFGYSALMITDTAFYRNKNYHETTDTIETLNLTKMAQVISTLATAIAAF